MGTVLSSTQERAFSLSQEASQVVSLLARGGELLGRRACGGAGWGGGLFLNQKRVDSTFCCMSCPVSP